ncbi:hypothetical protein [Caudoviricetes sp.]|nr:hypothetical protein [Caudoviricetes sp.]
MSRLVVATYRRWSDATGTERPVVVVARCEQIGDDVCVVWDEQTRADMLTLGFDAEEYAGAIEAAEERFWQLEEAACAASYVAQRQGLAAE